jgi:hypothetical protein
MCYLTDTGNKEKDMTDNDRHLKVSFTRAGYAVVTNERNDHRVVVGKATPSEKEVYPSSGMWTLSSYANTNDTRMKAYYGRRKSDLVPFAKAVYHKIMREAGA